MKRILIILNFLLLSAYAQAQIVVNPDKELMILDTKVVDDPVRTVGCGAWSFCRMMTQLAGPNQNASDFTLTWLNTWLVDKKGTGFFVSKRTNVQNVIINPWPKLADGRLDLQKAPFRLLAIVNRIDLRKSGAGHSGEGRFVFGLTDRTGNPLSMTVIFEFKLWNEIQPLDQWAKDFHSLGNSSLVLGTTYNAALELITNKFVMANLPLKANGSAIGQVRTNEIALSSPWELREFRLNKTSGKLIHQTVAQTPVPEQNFTAELANYINANETAILKGTHVIKLPLTKGRSALTDFSVWDAVGITNSEARHKFAVNTCNGCHGPETQTSFLHVSNRVKGSQSFLSSFFRNENVFDGKGIQRNFNELARRKQNYEALLTLIAPSSAASAELNASGNVDASSVIMPETGLTIEEQLKVTATPENAAH